ARGGRQGGGSPGAGNRNRGHIRAVKVAARGRDGRRPAASCPRQARLPKITNTLGPTHVPPKLRFKPPIDAGSWLSPDGGNRGGRGVHERGRDCLRCRRRRTSAHRPRAVAQVGGISSASVRVRAGTSDGGSALQRNGDGGPDGPAHARDGRDGTREAAG